MNLSIGKKFEQILERQVKSGLYESASEAVRDAIRHTFTGHDDSDDTEFLAEKLREGKSSPVRPWKKEEALALITKYLNKRKRLKS